MWGWGNGDNPKSTSGVNHRYTGGDMGKPPLPQMGRYPTGDTHRPTIGQWERAERRGQTMVGNPPYPQMGVWGYGEEHRYTSGEAHRWGSPQAHAWGGGEAHSTPSPQMWAYTSPHVYPHMWVSTLGEMGAWGHGGYAEGGSVNPIATGRTQIGVDPSTNVAPDHASKSVVPKTFAMASAAFGGTAFPMRSRQSASDNPSSSRCSSGSSND